MKYPIIVAFILIMISCDKQEIGSRAQIESEYNEITEHIELLCLNDDYSSSEWFISGKLDSNSFCYGIEDIESTSSAHLNIFWCKYCTSFSNEDLIGNSFYFNSIIEFDSISKILFALSTPLLPVDGNSLDEQYVDSIFALGSKNIGQQILQTVDPEPAWTNLNQWEFIYGPFFSNGQITGFHHRLNSPNALLSIVGFKKWEEADFIHYLIEFEASGDLQCPDTVDSIKNQICFNLTDCNFKVNFKIPVSR